MYKIYTKNGIYTQKCCHFIRCWTELVEGGFLSHKNSGVLGINDDQIISPLGMLNLNINNIWRVGSRGGDGIFDLKTGAFILNFKK